MFGRNSGRSAISPGNGRSAAFAVLCAILFPLIAISLFVLPVPMDNVALDWTWQSLLFYFAKHRFQFGPQVIYTYGPLGFLQSAVNPGIYISQMFLAHVAMAILGATIFIILIWRSRSWPIAIGLTLAVLVFGEHERDSFAVTSVAILAAMALSGTAPAWLLVLLSVTAAFFSLIKFTYLLYSTASVALIVSFFLICRDRRRSVLAGASFVVSFLTFWVFAAHQHLSGLPSYIRGCLEITGGFNETMTSQEQGNVLAYAVTQVVLVLASAGFLLTGRQRLAANFQFIVVAAATFVLWKQGIVRADWAHTFTLPLGAQILSFLVFAQLSGPDARQQRIRLLATLPVAASLLVSLAFISDPAVALPQPILSATRTLSTFETQASYLFGYSRYRDYLRDVTEKTKAEYQFPKFSSDIGNATIDIFGDDAGIAILNGWNYFPRPVFQSFSVYNRYLQDRNERFITSEYAPDYYLLVLKSIDLRLPADPDSASLKAILSRYEQVDEERGYLLFRKKDEYRTRILASGVAAVGQEIAIDPSWETNRMIELSVDVRPSPLGDVRSLVFKSAQATLRVRTVSGGASDFRLLAPLARFGTPIWPKFEDTAALRAFLGGHKPDLVSWISIVIADGDKKLFEPTFSYTIKETLPIGSGPRTN